MNCRNCGETLELGKYVDDLEKIDGDDLELKWLCDACGTRNAAQYTLVDVRVLED